MKDVASVFKLIGVSVKYGIALVGAAVLGGVFVIFAQWGYAELGPSHGGVFDLIPVKLVNITERDQWLLNYDVFFAPVLDEDSRYGLLVVMPHREKSAMSPPYGKHGFLLSGYASNSVKPVPIDGGYLVRNVGKPEIILLDFIRFSDDVEGKTLVLQSMEN